MTFKAFRMQPRVGFSPAEGGPSLHACKIMRPYHKCSVQQAEDAGGCGPQILLVIAGSKAKWSLLCTLAARDVAQGSWLGSFVVAPSVLTGAARSRSSATDGRRYVYGLIVAQYSAKVCLLRLHKLLSLLRWRVEYETIIQDPWTWTVLSREAA